MIDEKHRHEIAEAMRRCNPKAFGWPMGLAAAIAQASDGGQDPLNELADLIDRQTCHDTEERVDSFTCSSCGFSEGKIVFNPFTYSFRMIKPGWKYCPNCGAMVADTLYARKMDGK